ncbi:hypothetical protein IAI10_22000 [Clostridium sp. 19966]|nr:hypothetical protein [Clostridium sp. 19966]MDT8719331.1 hypothetical protein [Clostridium sp. 19966]
MGIKFVLGIMYYLFILFVFTKVFMAAANFIGKTIGFSKAIEWMMTKIKK